MRIIKPYGQSHVAPSGVIDAAPQPTAITDGQDIATSAQRPTLTLRRLKQKSNRTETRNIPDFAKTDPELVIAQWISIIDKIATKPKTGEAASHEQHDLRTTLGNAAWAHLTSKQLLDRREDQSIDDLKVIWDWKIAPYRNTGTRQDKSHNSSQSGKSGKSDTPPKAEGNWYKTFCGTITPTDMTKKAAEQIVEKIHTHLYAQEYSRCHGKPRHAKGMIARRAESIEKNILRAKGPDEMQSPALRNTVPDDTSNNGSTAISPDIWPDIWSNELQESYQSPHGSGPQTEPDIAARIYTQYQDLRAKKPKSSPNVISQHAFCMITMVKFLYPHRMTPVNIAPCPCNRRKRKNPGCSPFIRPYVIIMPI